MLFHTRPYAYKAYLVSKYKKEADITASFDVYAEIIERNREIVE